MNVLLTRSFISFFSRLPGSKILPFDISDAAAREKGFFSGKSADFHLAIQIAQALGCSRVIFGAYETDDRNLTIGVDVFAYDSVSGELIFKRHYTGKTGPALLDTIDLVRKDAAGLLTGMTVPVAQLQISITNTDAAYYVLLNGIQDGIAAPDYKKELPAGPPIDLTLRRTNDGREVFRTNIVFPAGSDVTIVYYPMAPVFIQSSKSPVDIIMNGRRAGGITNSDTYILGGLPAGSRYSFYVQNGELRSFVKDADLKEGDPVALNFGERDFYQRLDYRGLDTAWDLLLPGLVQLEAKDYWPSAIFGGLWVIDAGVFGYYLYGYLLADYIVNNDPRDYYRAQVLPYRNAYETYSAIAGLAWAGLAAGSWLHASLMAGAEEKEKQFTVYPAFSDGGIALCFEIRFN
jgi:hypothetical protein